MSENDSSPNMERRRDIAALAREGVRRGVCEVCERAHAGPRMGAYDIYAVMLEAEADLIAIDRFERGEEPKFGKGKLPAPSQTCCECGGTFEEGTVVPMDEDGAMRHVECAKTEEKAKR